MYLTFNTILESTLVGLIYFAGGIVIGLILIFILQLVLKLIRKKSLKKKVIINKIEPSYNPSYVIEDYKNIFLTNYEQKKLKEKLSGLKEMSTLYINDIAKCYYPDSKKPIYEVDINSLLYLSNKIIDELDDFINQIISSSAFKIVWAIYAAGHNIKSFFTNLFKKTDNNFVNVNIRKVKIARIVEIIDSKSNSENKEEKESIKILDNFINNQILKLIEKVGNEAICVYSNSYKLSKLNAEEAR